MKKASNSLVSTCTALCLAAVTATASTAASAKSTNAVPAAVTDAPLLAQVSTVSTTTTVPSLRTVTTPALRNVTTSALTLTNQPPRRGIGMIIGGSVTAGIGLGFFIPGLAMAISMKRATEAAGIEDDVGVSSARRIISWILLTPGLLGLGIGTPLIAVGAVRQSRYNKWRSEHQASLLPMVSFPRTASAGSPGRGGYGGLQYSFKF